MTGEPPPPRASEDWRYEIEVEPLSAEGYGKVVRALLAPAVARGRGRRRLIAACIGALFAALAVLLAYGGDATLIARVGFGVPDDLEFYGGTAALLVFGLLCLGYALAGVASALASRSLMAQVHAGSLNLHDRHTLRLGEAGILWTGPTSEMRFAWAAATRLVRDGDLAFLVMHGAVALWFRPDDLGADRDAILAYIGEEIGRTATRHDAARPASPG